MRTHQLAVTLSLAAALAACSRQDSPTAAQAKATQPAHPTDLAGAPQTYKRMRFVSALEQSATSVQKRSAGQALRATHVGTSHHTSVAARPSLASLITNAPVTITVASASAAETPVSITSSHAAPPMVMPLAAATEVVADGGRMHGLSSHVAIRGGVVPNGKCDPRSDAQASGMLAGRPNSAMPMMPSSSVFGRR